MAQECNKSQLIIGGLEEEEKTEPGFENLSFVLQRGGQHTKFGPRSSVQPKLM